MTTANRVRLGDVLEVQSGFAFKKEFFTHQEGVPLIRIRDLDAEDTETKYNGPYREEFLVSRGDFLIGMDGEFRCHIWKGPKSLLNQRVCRLRNFASSIVPMYLYYGIQRYLSTIEAQTAFVTVKHISGRQIEEIEMPLPAVDDQQRIVDLLSRAENIVRMRREAEASAKEIIPALFLDMFGDPATNPRGWTVRRFGDLVERLEGGKNVQSGTTGDSAFRILKISAVTSGTYDESEAKPAPPGFDPPEHYFVRDGDILFSRANTEALVGATAMVNTTEGNALLPDKLWRLMWRPAEGLAPTYMLALLQNRSVRKELSKIASGTGGSMKNISQAKLLELHLPIAPVALQRAFENRLATVRSLLNGTRRAGGLAEQAFQSLLAGVFSEEQAA